MTDTHHRLKTLPFNKFLSVTGDLASFSIRSVVSAFFPPFEWVSFFSQLEQIGSRSVPLIVAAGLALGVVMTLHTRGTMVTFGAEAWIPSVQSAAFLNELGPMITALLMAGRVGSGIGAELANMRVTEQIDAAEAMAIDSFKFLVVTRVMACIIALPLLTTFLDFTAVAGGFLSEHFTSNISLQLYVNSAFRTINWVNFVPPTLKTAVFGFLIGGISTYFGFTMNEGSSGVRRAATLSVVVSSLLIILSDVILVKLIFFFSPTGAL